MTNVSQYKERGERRRFGLPVIILLSDTGIELPGRLNDISEGGLSFRSNTAFPEGELVDIVIPYPKLPLYIEEPIPFNLRVEVRWNKVFSDSEDQLAKYVHGCKFVLDEVASEVQKQVKKLLELSIQLGEIPIKF